MDLSSLWQLLQPYVASQLRHLIASLGFLLVSKGALAADQEGAFASILEGIVMWVIAGAWAWWKHSGQEQALQVEKAISDRWRAKASGKAPAP